MRSKAVMLEGWGRYPAHLSAVYRPESSRDILLAMANKDDVTFLPRGLGRSYGDNALNECHAVLLSDRQRRFISFDDQTGLLECEAGVSIDEIIRTFLPRGWFIPVTPGTKYVTIGGAIANDVHGKNHHQDGTFSKFVDKLTLLLGNGQIVSCSPYQHRELFWATVGGAGLTGMILTAAIRLLPVENAYMAVTYRKAGHIEQALELLEQSDDLYQYSVAWIDCLADGKRLGRSVLMQANHAGNELIGQAAQRFRLGKTRAWTVPFDFPAICLNPFTIGLFNRAYYALHRNGANAIAHFDPFFYPLDSIRRWNRLYGKRGFVQYQFVLPYSQAREGLVRILERISASRRSSFLAVLKRFGEQGEGLLSFPFRGFTLSLDIPMADGLPAFLHELDELVLKYDGRIYLAKDAVMKPETFKKMYPRLPAFRQVLAEWDPQRRWSSSQARRLEITGGDRVGK